MTPEEFLKKNNVREDIVIKSTIPGVCVSTFKLVDLLTAYATQKPIPVDWEKVESDLVPIIDEWTRKSFGRKILNAEYRSLAKAILSRINPQPTERMSEGELKPMLDRYKKATAGGMAEHDALHAILDLIRFNPQPEEELKCNTCAYRHKGLCSNSDCKDYSEYYTIPKLDQPEEAVKEEYPCDHCNLWPCVSNMSEFNGCQLLQPEPPQSDTEKG